MNGERNARHGMNPLTSVYESSKNASVVAYCQAPPHGKRTQTEETNGKGKFRVSQFHDGFMHPQQFYEDPRENQDHFECEEEEEDYHDYFAVRDEAVEMEGGSDSEKERPLEDANQCVDVHGVVAAARLKKEVPEDMTGTVSDEEEGKEIEDDERQVRSSPVGLSPRKPSDTIAPPAAENDKSPACAVRDRVQSEPLHDTSYAAILAADEARGKKQKRRKKDRRRVLNCSHSKYPVIRELAEEFGFQTIESDDEFDRLDCNMVWADTVMPRDRLAKLASWQRANHFPSMHLLTRKLHLGLTLGRMRKVFPTHFAFFPRTWSLRSERNQFIRYLSSKPANKKTYILKPNAGCQGKGIVLSRDPLNAVEDVDDYVVQEYVTKPLLIDNKKFDLRVYVLVTSVRYLSVHIYNEGLVRMCAEDYAKPTADNLDNPSIHLTNYAVNKANPGYVKAQGGEGDNGHKRNFRWLNQWLEEHGHDSNVMWTRVEHMVNKSICSAQAPLAHVYNALFPLHDDGFTCFEVLGFDILIDEKLKPWLIEINHTPSFACDTPLDHRIKHSLLTDAWNIINVQAADKARYQERAKASFAKRMNGTVGTPPLVSTSLPPEFDSNGEFDWKLHLDGEDRRSRNFKRIFPSRNPARASLYNEIIQTSRDLHTTCQMTASQEARQHEVRLEREKREQGNNPNQKPRKEGNSGPDIPPVSSNSLAPKGSGPNNSSFSGASNSRAQAAPRLSDNDASGRNSPARRVNSMRNGNKQRAIDLEKQRQKLQEQMEKHRRRINLGPRLSVFQLREAQQVELAMMGMDVNTMCTGPSGGAPANAAPFEEKTISQVEPYRPVDPKPPQPAGPYSYLTSEIAHTDARYTTMVPVESDGAAARSNSGVSARTRQPQGQGQPTGPTRALNNHSASRSNPPRHSMVGGGFKLERHRWPGGGLQPDSNHTEEQRVH